MNPKLPVRQSRLLDGYVCSTCTRHLRRPRRSYATAAALKPDIYDVVCVGGGPAGLSLLAALRMLPQHISQDLTPFTTNMFIRFLACNSQPESCFNREPRSQQDTLLLSPSHPILKQMQLSHTFLGAIP